MCLFCSTKDLDDNPMILERVLKSALQDLDIVMKNLASLQESVNNNTADEYTEYDIEDNNLLIVCFPSSVIMFSLVSWLTLRAVLCCAPMSLLKSFVRFSLCLAYAVSFALWRL